MSDELKIITNNVPRDLIYGFELSEDERKDFDYYTEEQLATAQFFRYKGEVYGPGEFMANDSIVAFNKKWDGYQSDTFFSGILIRWCNDYESVVVGRYMS